MTRRITRRAALKGAAAAGLAAPFVCSRSLRAAPGERITLGFIGVGTMGRGHLRNFLGRGDVQVVAVCDVGAGTTDSPPADPHADSVSNAQDTTAQGTTAQVGRRRSVTAVLRNRQPSG